MSFVFGYTHHERCDTMRTAEAAQSVAVGQRQRRLHFVHAGELTASACRHTCRPGNDHHPAFENLGDATSRHGSATPYPQSSPELIITGYQS